MATVVNMSGDVGEDDGDVKEGEGGFLEQGWCASLQERIVHV